MAETSAASATTDNGNGHSADQPQERLLDNIKRFFAQQGACPVTNHSILVSQVSQCLKTWKSAVVAAKQSEADDESLSSLRSSKRRKISGLPTSPGLASSSSSKKQQQQQKDKASLPTSSLPPIPAIAGVAQSGSSSSSSLLAENSSKSQKVQDVVFEAAKPFAQQNTRNVLGILSTAFADDVLHKFESDRNRLCPDPCMLGSNGKVCNICAVPLAPSQKGDNVNNHHVPFTAQGKRVCPRCLFTLCQSCVVQSLETPGSYCYCRDYEFGEPYPAVQNRSWYMCGFW
eukprot:TRINITY_DN1828_c0_g1_i1.p1 TRINITY_DN1828_c0_g1~~TRINITY_DN1828_c0_g1_i1.p1  ORF type:complete len:310 (-),score=57.61 TRINITY_DN1828_c0_g1_i1:952-1812(-)